jgi:large subunit ribosomal protein L18
MITPKFVIKDQRSRRVRKTIRKKVNGSPQRPRMIVVRSNKYIYTQVIDDQNHTVLASASTLEKGFAETLKSKKDTDAAKVLGKTIAERLKGIQIEQVVFDRNIYAFMGRIKAFADAARENGLKF